MKINKKAAEGEEREREALMKRQREETGKERPYGKREALRGEERQ